MFSGEVRAIFLIGLVVGHILISVVLQMYSEAFGTIINKNGKWVAIFFTFVVIGYMLYFKVLSSEMDMPGILSMRYQEMEGVVRDYKIEVGKGGMNTVKVREKRTGKVFRFSYVDIPSGLRRGDLVKIHYLKHNKTGVIAEINGKKIEYHVYHFWEGPVGITLIILLLFSMPVYYFWIYKVKPITEYKATYTAYAYHDLYIKAMKIVYFFMIQTAAVLAIAVRGDYKTSWDWYWVLLLIADYGGVFCLSFLRRKQFAIVKDKFYYCNFKKRAEGELSEIESVEETDTGVIIRTKEAEMEVLCTSKHYREALINKLA